MPTSNTPPSSPGPTPRAKPTFRQTRHWSKVIRHGFRAPMNIAAHEPLAHMPGLDLPPCTHAARPCSMASIVRKPTWTAKHFRWQIVAKIDAFMTAQAIPVSTTTTLDGPTATPPPEMKRALAGPPRRMRTRGTAEISNPAGSRNRKQTWAKKHKPAVNPAKFRPTLTTR